MGEEMATRRSEATPRVIGREALGPGLLQPSSVAFLPMPLVHLSSHEGQGESQRKAPLFVPKASGRRRSPRRGGQLLPFLCASDFSAWRAQPPGGLRGVLLGDGCMPGIAAACPGAGRPWSWRSTRLIPPAGKGRLQKGRPWARGRAWNLLGMRSCWKRFSR